MLVRNHDAQKAAAHSSQFLWDTIARHRPILIAFPLLFLGLSAIYVSIRGSSFTATSRLVVDNRVLQFNPQEAFLPTSSISAPLLQSQVAILQSDKIALSAIRALGLTKDPEFLPPNFTGSDEEKELQVLENIQNKIHASRIGESYLIDVRATSTDPVKAAKITNALVKAYLDDQTSSNADVANAVSPWLRSKVASLGTTARVVSEATPPLKRDQLPNRLILALGLASGLIFGFTLAFALDWFDNRIKTREAVEKVCGAECFGMLPCMKKKPWYARLGLRKRARSPGGQTVEDEPSLLWAIDHPQSHFVHALRNTRAAILEQKESNPVIIGITSPASGEGKSVVAANLSRLMAIANRKVLLIDADPYGASLTALLTPTAVRGLAQALDGRNLTDLLWTCDRTGLQFLPNPAGDHRSHPGNPLSAANQEFFSKLAQEYDWIFLDLPPLDPVPDVREAQPLVQGMLLVLEWNKISASRLQTLLDSAGPLRSKLIGVLFNKAGEKMFRKQRSPSPPLKRAVRKTRKFKPEPQEAGTEAPAVVAEQTSPPVAHVE